MPGGFYVRSHKVNIPLLTCYCDDSTTDILDTTKPNMLNTTKPMLSFKSTDSRRNLDIWVFLWGKLLVWEKLLVCFSTFFSFSLLSLRFLCFRLDTWSSGATVIRHFPVGHLEFGCNRDSSFFQLDIRSSGATEFLIFFGVTVIVCDVLPRPRCCLVYSLSLEGLSTW